MHLSSDGFYTALVLSLSFFASYVQYSLCCFLLRFQNKFTLSVILQQEEHKDGLIDNVIPGMTTTLHEITSERSAGGLPNKVTVTFSGSMQSNTT